MQCTWRGEWEDPDATEKHQSGQSEGRKEDPVHAPAGSSTSGRDVTQPNLPVGGCTAVDNLQACGLRGLGAGRPGASRMPWYSCTGWCQPPTWMVQVPEAAPPPPMCVPVTPAGASTPVPRLSFSGVRPS